jgi:drug/metabolite transporter (DMT)-like permease
MSRLPETALLTALALIAFASNSILTRLGLGGGEMDAATFTLVRIAAGAVVLAALVRIQHGPPGAKASRARGGRVGSVGWVGPVALFAYAAPFSFAYVRIGAAAGALLLFAAVQITMIGRGIAAGERPGLRGWAGIALAAAGLGWLTLPAVGRPDPIGSALMIVAGCSWGVYSLAGRRATDALAANGRSFAWAVPLAVGVDVAAAAVGSVKVSPRGLVLAVASGAITSGLGYAIWYRALRGLTATQAAILQLSVPLIAAAGAVVVLHEALNPRLAISSAAVIGGVALVLSAPRSGNR